MGRKRTASLAWVKAQRDLEKVRRVIIAKGYSSGKLQKGKHIHHVKPVAQGGATTTHNTKVVSAGKHKRIHRNRSQKGQL